MSIDTLDEPKFVAWMPQKARSTSKTIRNTGLEGPILTNKYSIYGSTPVARGHLK